MASNDQSKWSVADGSGLEAGPEIGIPLEAYRPPSHLDKRHLRRGRASDVRQRASDFGGPATALNRTQLAMRRDEAARLSDLTASSRDVAADARDRAAARRAAPAAARASRELVDPTRFARITTSGVRGGLAPADPADPADVACDRQGAAADRSHAAADRAGAAGDRQRAAADRRQAAADRRQAHVELESAQLDSLTGVHLRDVGRLNLQAAIDQSRLAAEPFVLAFIDVDGLKELNDSEGHAAGDALLRAVGGVLKSKLRRYDAIARVGGDEFLCGLSNTELDASQLRFEEIRTAVEEGPETGSITVGLASLEPDDTLEDLMARADLDMYAHKPTRRRASDQTPSAD